MESQLYAPFDLFRGTARVWVTLTYYYYTATTVAVIQRCMAVCVLLSSMRWRGTAFRWFVVVVLSVLGRHRGHYDSDVCCPGLWFPWVPGDMEGGRGGGRGGEVI